MKNSLQLNMPVVTNNYPDLLEEAINIMNTHQQSKRYFNKPEMNVGQKGSNGKEGNHMLPLQ